MNRCKRLEQVVCLTAVFLLTWGMSAGCSGPSTTSAPSDEVRAFDVSTLPTLGDYLPPLDQDRIEIAPPATWAVPPGAGSHLVRFKADPSQPYPLLLLSAEGVAGVSDTTSETVGELVALLVARGTTSAARPVAIGDFVGAAYRKKGRDPSSTSRLVDRLILATVVDGRLYQLELRDWEGRMESHEKRLYAVAGGLRFASRGKQASDVPVEEEGGTSLDDQPEISADDAFLTIPTPTGPATAPAAPPVPSASGDRDPLDALEDFLK